MRIPSYDDLTPSIPDITPSDVLASAASLLPPAGPVVMGAAPRSSAPPQLFAALHGDAAARDRLAAIASDFSPRIEWHPGGTVVLDVSGLQRLLGDASAIAGDLHRAGAARVAVAASQIAAQLLARARDGITVATGAPDEALRDVPIAVLQQHLADRRSAAAAGRPVRPRAARRDPAFDVLGRWGLTTVGELAALPAAELSARLGAEGVAIQQLARGIDARPLVPDPGVARFTGSFELEWPVDTLEPLSFVFARLLDPLAAALERADRGAIAVRLDLRLTDRTAYARMLPLPAAMRDPRVLRTLLLLDLESHPPSAAVDVVTIEIDPAPARIVQYSLLERAVPSPETLATLIARLGALVGEARCGSPALLDSHQPDAFAMCPVAFPERSTTAAGGGAPGQPVLCLRRFRPPVAVRVAVDAGRPARIAIDRRGMPGGDVQQAAGPWRSSGGWWERTRWNRDEWDVALSDGTVCRLFRDRDSGAWFLEGVFD
jgi:protein ImuB